MTPEAWRPNVKGPFKDGRWLEATRNGSVSTTLSPSLVLYGVYVIGCDEETMEPRCRLLVPPVCLSGSAVFSCSVHLLLEPEPFTWHFGSKPPRVLLVSCWNRAELIHSVSLVRLLH